MLNVLNTSSAELPSAH